MALKCGVLTATDLKKDNIEAVNSIITNINNIFMIVFKMQWIRNLCSALFGAGEQWFNQHNQGCTLCISFPQPGNEPISGKTTAQKIETTGLWT